MVYCLNVQTEPCTDERAMGVRVGVGCQHPAFMLVVAKDLHQAGQIELDVGILKLKELLRPVCQQGLVLRKQGDGGQSQRFHGQQKGAGRRNLRESTKNEV